MGKLSHLSEDGKVLMVDVSPKPDSERVAIAKGEVSFPKDAFKELLEEGSPKGDFLACARVAGILAAKKTPELIPLCHPLPISKVELDFSIDQDRCLIEVQAMVKCTGKTGVEMEALTAVSVAALTIYDMCKALSKAIKIQNIRLVYKAGGKSGEVRLEQ